MLLKSVEFETAYGKKTIDVYCEDVNELPVFVDVLVTSAFKLNYSPTFGTVIGAIYNRQAISVDDLAENPELDLRNVCDIWLSKEITPFNRSFRRIGCIELTPLYGEYGKCDENSVFEKLSAFFYMLSIAEIKRVPVRTVALPILGAGNQGLPPELVATPMLRACIDYLERSASTERIVLFERNLNKAGLIADRLEKSYGILAKKNEAKKINTGRHIFISYSSRDKNVADNLCAKLESRGRGVWYAPRNLSMSSETKDYASSIYRAISECSDFIVILSKNSLVSEHVLNEVDLAFKRASTIRIKPLKLDEEELGDAFLYYLSRQHWMDATLPPLEERLNEFADGFII